MPNKFLKVLNESTAPEILIHGPIGKSMWSDEGVSGKDFTDALNKFPEGSKVTIGVNSQGGSVGEGLAIFNAIERRAKDITVRIDGYALSIASFFPLAAGKVVSPKSSIWMIHNAWSWSQGNADQLRKDADMLDTHDGVLVAGYMKRTGKSKADIEKAMADETWLTGEEAIAWGLADEDSGTEVDLKALDFSNAPDFKQEVILSYFSDSHIPRCLVPASMVFLPLSAPKPGAAQQQTIIMTKQQIIALLKKHGVESAVDATEEQLLALLEKTIAASNNTNATHRLLKLVEDEKRKRITNEVNRLAENKIDGDKLAWWVELAMKDEEGTLAQIKTLPVKEIGHSPAGTSGIITMGDNPLDALNKKHTTAQERRIAIRDEWKPLFDDACRRDARQRKEVLAGNTYSATLVTAFLSNVAITTLQNQWAALRAFTIQVEPDPVKPKAAVIVSNVTGAATTQTNATNFETSGDSTVGAVTCTMAQYTQGFQVSNADLQNGLRMERLVVANAGAFANKVIEAATAPITVAIFTATPLTSADTAFDWSDMAGLWGQLKKAGLKNAVLDGEYLARLINTPANFQTTGNGPGSYSAFGWNEIALNTDWTGAGANVRGFVCAPQAIAGATGLPAEPPNVPGNILEMSPFTIPGLEVQAAIHRWFSTSTRTAWTSFDIVAGFKEGDTTAGVVIKSA